MTNEEKELLLGIAAELAAMHKEIDGLSKEVGTLRSSLRGMSAVARQRMKNAERQARFRANKKAQVVGVTQPAFVGVTQPAFVGVTQPAFVGVTQPAFVGVTHPPREREQEKETFSPHTPLIEKENKEKESVVVVNARARMCALGLPEAPKTPPMPPAVVYLPAPRLDGSEKPTTPPTPPLLPDPMPRIKPQSVTATRMPPTREEVIAAARAHFGGRADWERIANEFYDQNELYGWETSNGEKITKWQPWLKGFFANYDKRKAAQSAGQRWERPRRGFAHNWRGTDPSKIQNVF